MGEESIGSVGMVLPAPARVSRLIKNSLVLDVQQCMARKMDGLGVPDRVCVLQQQHIALWRRGPRSLCGFVVVLVVVEAEAWIGVIDATDVM